jgi:hypothetical protein
MDSEVSAVTMTSKAPRIMTASRFTGMKSAVQRSRRKRSRSRSMLKKNGLSSVGGVRFIGSAVVTWS